MYAMVAYNCPLCAISCTAPTALVGHVIDVHFDCDRSTKTKCRTYLLAHPLQLVYKHDTCPYHCSAKCLNGYSSLGTFLEHWMSHLDIDPVLAKRLIAPFVSQQRPVPAAVFKKKLILTDQRPVCKVTNCTNQCDRNSTGWNIECTSCLSTVRRLFGPELQEIFSERRHYPLKLNLTTTKKKVEEEEGGEYSSDESSDNNSAMDVDYVATTTRDIVETVKTSKIAIPVNTKRKHVDPDIQGAVKRQRKIDDTLSVDLIEEPKLAVIGSSSEEEEEEDAMEILPAIVKQNSPFLTCINSLNKKIMDELCKSHADDICARVLREIAQGTPLEVHRRLTSRRWTTVITEDNEFFIDGVTSILEEQHKIKMTHRKEIDGIHIVCQW